MARVKGAANFDGCGGDDSGGGLGSGIGGASSGESAVSMRGRPVGALAGRLVRRQAVRCCRSVSLG